MEKINMNNKYLASEEKYLYWENQGKELKGIKKSLKIEKKICKNNGEKK